MVTKQQKHKHIVTASWLVAIFGAILVFFIPPPSMVTDVIAVHLRTATALLVAITSFGGSLLFLEGIQEFKTKLQIAYKLLAGGIMLLGIALMQLPVIGFLNLWDSWWTDSGLVIMPFVFASSLIYFGLRQFSLLLGIRSMLTSYMQVFGIAALITITSYYAGRYLALYRNMSGTDIYIAIVAWSAFCITCATLLARRIVERIGPFYHDAMQQLSLALAVLSFSAWHEYTINFFTDNNSWYVSHGASFIPFIISGLLILRAGYAFTLLGKTVPYIPVEQSPADKLNADFVQSLTSIAAFVPDSTTTTPILQSVQTATSEAQTKQPLTNEAKERFVHTYKDLEQYLTHNDPLKDYDKEELRSKLRPNFRAALEQQRPPQVKSKP